MSQKELIENLNEILNQKDTVLIPENIKSGINILGVEGSYKKEVELLDNLTELDNSTPEKDMLTIVYDKEINDLEGIYTSIENTSNSYIISNQGNKVYLPVFTNIWDSENCNGSSYVADFINNNSIIKVLTKDENGRLLTGEIFQYARKGYFIDSEGYINIFVDLSPLTRKLIAVNWSLNKIYYIGYENITIGETYNKIDFKETDELLSASTCYSDSSKSNIIIQPSSWQYDLEYAKVFEPLDTSEGNVNPEDIIEGKIAYSQGTTIKGSMKDNDYLYYTPSTENQEIPEGYTKGGTVWGDNQLSSENIKKDVEIFNVVGTYSGLDTTDATAIASDIIQGKTAYVQDIKIEGTMKDHGTKSITPSTEDQVIEEGHINKVTIIGDANLIQENIKKGITMFGIEGTLDTEIDMSKATATVEDILYGKTAYLADGSLATGKMPNGGAIYGHKFRECGHNANQTYISIYPTKGYYNGTSHTAAIYIPLKSQWYSATDEHKRFINELFTELGITPEILKDGVSLYTISGTFSEDATATSEDIVIGKTAYVKGQLVTGTLAVDTPIEIIEGTLSNIITNNDVVTISGSSNVSGTVAEGTNISIAADNETVASAIGLAPDLIKSGVNILGIEGTYGSEESEYNAKFKIPEGKTSGLTALQMLESVESLDTSEVTDASNIFTGCVALKSLPDMNLDKATSTYSMCARCINLVYVPNLNIAGSTNTANMFYNCSSLPSVPELNLASSANTSYMFANCSNITGISNLDMKVSANTSYMFADCYNLIEVNNLNIASSKVTTNMFANCSNLQNLNITMPKVAVTSLAGMFENCQNLKELPAMNYRLLNNSSGYAGSLTNYCQNCYSLTSVDLGGVSSYSRYDRHMENAFRNCNSLTNFRGMSGTSIQVGYYTYGQNLFYNCTNLTHVNDFHIYSPYMNNMFRNCYNLISFNNCKILDVPYGGAIHEHTFENCYNLTSVDGMVGMIGMNKNGEPSGLFRNCRSLQFTSPIYFNTFNFRYGNTSHNVFADCYSVSNIHIKGAGNGGGYAHGGYNWFTNCNSLTNLTIENCPIYFYNSFEGCTNLQTISFINSGGYACSGFFGNSSISNVANCLVVDNTPKTNITLHATYFYNCQNLTTTGNVTFYANNCINAFYNCHNLVNINEASFYNAYLLESLFMNCSNLVEAKCEITWRTDMYQRRISNMFAGCVNLVYVQSFDMSAHNGTGSFISPFGYRASILDKTYPALTKLTYFEGFKNIGQGYSTLKSANNYYAAVDIVGAPNLSYESILNVTTNLANLYQVYNIAEGETLAYPQLIHMEINQYNKLNETDITNIQNLGWNIEVHTIPNE